MNRYAPGGEPRTLLDIVANLVHNAALLVIMVEVCLIYATAGWYKIQGIRWQDGTALYYPLQSGLLHALAGALRPAGGQRLMVMLSPTARSSCRSPSPSPSSTGGSRTCCWSRMMLEHAGIAVLLGLPFFSLAMIAADAVFLPTGFLRAGPPGRRPHAAARKRLHAVPGRGRRRVTGDPSPSGCSERPPGETAHRRPVACGRARE